MSAASDVCEYEVNHAYTPANVRHARFVYITYDTYRTLSMQIQQTILCFHAYGCTEHDEIGSLVTTALPSLPNMT